MQSPIRRKSSAQPGNQNARKHGYYSRVLSPDEKRYLRKASSASGIKEEIAVLRVKLCSLLSQENADLFLVLQTVKALGALCNLRSGNG
jgi:hypothetical protein